MAPTMRIAPQGSRASRAARGEIRDPRTASATSTAFFSLNVSSLKCPLSPTPPYTPPTVRVPLRGYGRLSGGTPHCVNAL